MRVCTGRSAGPRVAHPDHRCVAVVRAAVVYDPEHMPCGDVRLLAHHLGDELTKRLDPGSGSRRSRSRTRRGAAGVAHRCGRREIEHAASFDLETVDPFFEKPLAPRGHGLAPCIEAWGNPVNTGALG